jgi:hypothetical protein
LFTASWAPVLAAPSQQSQLQTDAARLDHVAVEVDDAVVAEDWDDARSEWAEFDELWDDVEDGFRAADRDGYRAIEATMSDIVIALTTDAPDPDQIRELIATLRARIAPFAGTDDS